MKIDYVIISSDDSHYLDYYTPVSSQWSKFNIKTAMFHITNESHTEHNDFGVYSKIKAIEGIPTGFQAQIVRLYGHFFLPNKITLTSDIDMLPLDIDFFSSKLSYLSEYDIVNLSGQPYTDVPYFPMCYILSKSNSMINILNLDKTFESFAKRIFKQFEGAWNSDERFLYSSIKNYKNLKSIYTRNFKKDRIDRSNWSYNTEHLKKRKYIDSHLLRPYKKNKGQISTLIKGS